MHERGSHVWGRFLAVFEPPTSFPASQVVMQGQEYQWLKTMASQQGPISLPIRSHPAQGACKEGAHEGELVKGSPGISHPQLPFALLLVRNSIVTHSSERKLKHVPLICSISASFIDRLNRVGLVH